MLVIKKRPTEKYANQHTFCLSASEMNTVLNCIKNKSKAKIEIYDQGSELIKSIPRSKFDSIEYTSRTSYDNGSAFFIANYASLLA